MLSSAYRKSRILNSGLEWFLYFINGSIPAWQLLSLLTDWLQTPRVQVNHSKKWTNGWQLNNCSPRSCARRTKPNLAVSSTRSEYQPGYVFKTASSDFACNIGLKSRLKLQNDSNFIQKDWTGQETSNFWISYQVPQHLWSWHFSLGDFGSNMILVAVDYKEVLLWAEGTQGRYNGAWLGWE